MTLNAFGDAYRRAGDADHAAEAYRRGLAAAEWCGSKFERGQGPPLVGDRTLQPSPLIRLRQAVWPR